MAQYAAVGAGTSVSYVAETAFGTTPTSPTMKALRAKLGSKFELKRDTFASKEMSATRQVQALTYGNRSGSAEIPFELSYGSYDDFLEAVMGGTWAANVLKCGSVKRSFTFEQRWSDINYNEQTTGVVLTGFSLAVKPNTVVEGSFSALFKDQSAVQMASDGTTTVAFAAAGKTLTRSAGSFITDGFAVGDSVTISGASVSGNNQTIVITTLTATVLTASAATISDDTAKTGVTIAKTLGSPTAANTNAVFDSFTGTALIDGATSAIITSLDLKLDQAGNVSNVLFDATAQQVALGTINVTGTANFRFVNGAMKKKFLAGTSFDLQFTLGATSKMYQFDMSTCKPTGATIDTGENEVFVAVPFTAIYNSGDATSLMITRTP